MLFKLKRSISAVWAIASIEWIKLFCSTKLFILGILFIFLNEQIIGPMKECSGLMEEKLSILEPFVVLCNSGVVMLVLPLFYLTMVSDVPQEEGSLLFSHIRISKIKWLLGELLFVVLSSVTMILLMLMAASVLILGYSDFRMQYSDALTKFSSRFPKRTGDYILQLLPQNLYQQIDMKTALLYSILSLFLYFCLLSLVIILFSIMNRKWLGILIDGVLIFMGAVTCSLRIQLMWCFPMAHTVIWLHYSEYYSKPLFPPEWSCLYFGVILVVLITVSILLRKKYQIR